MSSKPNPVLDILHMAKSIAGNIPMPIAFASEDGSPPILLDDMIQQLETMEQAKSATVVNGVAVPVERTCTKVEMGEVCGDPESHHYSLTHPFECAGVAQSAEQDFRKVEAAGSTPVPSSKPHGLSADQHQLVATIVHHRVAAEDNRRAIAAAEQSIKEAENTCKKAVNEAKKIIANASRQGQHNMEQMLLTEENLRQSILSDVIVKGAPVPEPTPSADEEDDQIGRSG